MEIPFLRLSADAILPTKGHPDDAGFDLYVTKQMFVDGRPTDIPCGVAVELPPGTWGLLTGRSSTIRKRGIVVNTGIIDRGYRGELFVSAHTLDQMPKLIKPGERLAQLIIMSAPAEGSEAVWVEELSDHPRGLSGFGSTGS